MQKRGFCLLLFDVKCEKWVEKQNKIGNGEKSKTKCEKWGEKQNKIGNGEKSKRLIQLIKKTR